MLEESVVYQDIFKKGKKQGVPQGFAEGERKIARRLLERRFGKLSSAVQRQIDRLVVEQLEALCEALLDFQTKEDLMRWLKQHAAAR